MLVWGMVWGGVGCEQPPVSHERIARLDPQEVRSLVEVAGAGVSYAGEPLPVPEGGSLNAAEEVPMRAAPGDGQQLEEPGRRSAAFRPDRVTELEGDVGYYAVFTPSVAPFKRVSALDAVVAGDDDVPVLGVSQDTLRPVPVEGPRTPPPDGRARDRFWGSVVLDFREGRTVPLPTVSPESRILELHAEPEVELEVSRDGADNLFVTAPPLPPAQVRLTYMLDAPRSYFGAPLPDHPSDLLAGKLFPLPPSVKAQGAVFAAELGLSRGMPVDAALEALARHFRSFVESRDPPDDTGDIYLDLARGGRGVCRHRAYAFVITAQVLGIPARFVQNEAHAWVEVEVDPLGWLRLDLGGAPHGLVAHGTDQRPAYEPTGPDPWPRPEAYVQAEAMAAAAQAGAAATRTAAQGVQQGGQERRAEDDSLKPTLAEGQGQVARAGGETRPADTRAAVRLRLDSFEDDVLRGQLLTLRGRAETLEGAEPIEGLRIEVSLAQAHADRAVLLGVAVTDAEGAFEGAFAVPPDLPPNDYKLVVVTPGDAAHASARAP